MIETILSTVLSSTILTTPVSPKIPSTPQVVFTQVLPEENYVSYVVQPNDTLKSIAFFYYGSEDAWTILAKDNPGIEDPNNFTAGHLIKIRTKSDQKSQEVTPQVVQKDTAFAEQLSETTAGVSAMSIDNNVAIPTTPTANYSIQLVTPTTTPISESTVPIVTQSPTTVDNVSIISDEAITYLGNCEAGMNPTRNTGNGYYGAFQFSYGTWKSMNTGYERADLAPIEVQKAAVKQLLQRSSIFSQFPGCAVKMRSAGLI